VKNFSDLFTEEYSTQRDQWEKALKAELKLDDISAKTTKRHLDLGFWPTLSEKAPRVGQLKSTSAWKKAAQTYLRVNKATIAQSLNEDLEGGVRAFYFSGDHLNEADWKLVEATLAKFEKKAELEVYLLGKKSHTTTSSLKVVQGPSIIDGREIHEQGGHNVQELALLTLNLIENLDKNPTHLAAYMDSHFFKNIAKLRAVKLLAQKVIKESGSKLNFSYLALNSYREWTLFERYSNMLRNNVQVASGYIGGADSVQSSGYQMIFELETTHIDETHNERSLRMSRNTSHILGLESMLGIVEDAAFGSYHIENLSQKYAEEAWKLMQVLIVKSPAERKTFLDGEVKNIRETRLERVKTRKDVLTGMNDFPDGKEHLGVKLLPAEIFRVSRVFEEARLKVEGLKNKPEVEIILHGDYGALNNRVNFIKNYFELMGLTVHDPIVKHATPKQRVIVLCAKDEDYPELAAKVAGEKALAKFVAGKVDVPGFEAIHAGQNIFEILSNLVTKMEAQ
jgi:hypothetical protein